MNHFSSLIFLALVTACGGQTTTNGADAGADTGADVGPISECHGYCPQPNGSSCTSDCDCYEKCLGGTCAPPTATTITCGDDAAACPLNQQCSVMGTCEGATCAATADCPVEQQCLNEVCTFFGCI